MRKVMLSIVTMALIAASASQAFAAKPQHHGRKARQTTGDNSARRPTLSGNRASRSGTIRAGRHRPVADGESCEMHGSKVCS